MPEIRLTPSTRCAAFLIAAVGLFSSVSLLAQAAPAARSAHRAKPHASKAAAAPAPAPPIPAQPPKPNWPVNDAPQQPTVTWNAEGLRIQAANASLRQILNDVATTTGTKLEGLNRDERIFGTYGPAPARDVLSQLLHGTGYNVLMLGDLGQGTPREIVLSARNASSPANAQPKAAGQNADEDDQPEQVEQPEDQPPPPPIQPQIMRAPMNGPMNGPPNMPQQITPQERLQQMQQQQQEMQRQQQEQLRQMQQQQQNQPQ